MFWPITFDARPDLTTLDNRLAQDLQSSIWQKLDADKQGEGCINPERIFPSSVRQSGSERVEFADCRLRRSLRVPLSVLFGASADAAAGCLALSIERSQGAGNRLAPARTRHPPATNPPSGADVVRPGLPRGRQPAPAARALAVLQHHTGATASQASTLGGEPMDVCASSRAPAAPREIRALVIRFARDNSRQYGCGYLRRAKPSSSRCARTRLTSWPAEGEGDHGTSTRASGATARTDE